MMRGSGPLDRRAHLCLRGARHVHHPLGHRGVGPCVQQRPRLDLPVPGDHGAVAFGPARAVGHAPRHVCLGRRHGVGGLQEPLVLPHQHRDGVLRHPLGVPHHLERAAHMAAPGRHDRGHGGLRGRGPSVGRAVLRSSRRLPLLGVEAHRRQGVLEELPHPRRYRRGAFCAARGPLVHAALPRLRREPRAGRRRGRRRPGCHGAELVLQRPCARGLLGGGAAGGGVCLPHRARRALPHEEQGRERLRGSGAPLLEVPGPGRRLSDAPRRWRGSWWASSAPPCT